MVKIKFGLILQNSEIYFSVCESPITKVPVWNSQRTHFNRSIMDFIRDELRYERLLYSNH